MTRLWRFKCPLPRTSFSLAHSILCVYKRKYRPSVDMKSINFIRLLCFNHYSLFGELSIGYSAAVQAINFSFMTGLFVSPMKVDLFFFPHWTPLNNIVSSFRLFVYFVFGWLVCVYARALCLLFQMKSLLLLVLHCVCWCAIDEIQPLVVDYELPGRDTCRHLGLGLRRLCHIHGTWHTTTSLQMRRCSITDHRLAFLQ